MIQEKSPISVCALTLYPFDLVPGQRFRIEQWEPFLAEQGISIDYYSFADEKLTKTLPKQGNFLPKVGGLAKGFLKRLSHLSKLSKYDAIYIYRTAAIIGPALPERLIKLFGRPIIFDFDDAIFLTHTNESNKLFSWMKFAGKTGSICRLSTSVVAGNAWLAEYARKYNENVTVIPSSVNTESYLVKPKAARQTGKVIVGWTGSSTSQTHLEMFAPVLKEIVDRNPIEIHVHSDREPQLPGIPVVWHRWTPDNEVEVISNFDIGIMPLPDDEWSQGKCSMKALLYMSLGIPTVCSDVGMNREVIRDGENGFLASTKEEWQRALENLVGDESLRLKLGAAARKTVVETYSMTRCAEMFGKVVRDSIDLVNKQSIGKLKDESLRRSAPGANAAERSERAE
jgi:glycosyltransferase involved in cell wall biosynthesis